jgi:hypothetical protein
MLDRERIDDEVGLPGLGMRKHRACGARWCARREFDVRAASRTCTAVQSAPVVTRQVPEPCSRAAERPETSLSTYPANWSHSGETATIRWGGCDVTSSHAPATSFVGRCAAGGAADDAGPCENIVQASQKDPRI